jgi:hypothetical protein
VLPPQADRPMQGAIAQATKVSFESRIFNMNYLSYQVSYRCRNST